MKKLLLSILLLIPSFCITNNKQQIDKVALQNIKNEIVHVLQLAEKNLNDFTIEYGDLSIVPLKMTNEFFSHETIQKFINEISINITSLIFEKQSFNAIGNYLKDLSINQNDTDNSKIWQDITEKYKDEANQIYSQMLKKCRDTECDSVQCNNLHNSLWDLPMTFLMVRFTKIVFDNVLQKIEVLL